MLLGSLIGSLTVLQNMVLSKIIVMNGPDLSFLGEYFELSYVACILVLFLSTIVMIYPKKT